MPELLLELLSEEIPARMQARAAEDLERRIAAGFAALGLSHGRVERFVTPRRLGLAVHDVAADRPDLRDEKRGPRVGAPEQAIQGFLKSVGLGSIDRCEIRDVKGTKYYFAIVQQKGGRTAEAVASIVSEAIFGLSWPKSMRWGWDNRLSWVRPLHNILCVFDGAAVPFKLGGGGEAERAAEPPIHGLIANAKTSGHRFLAPETIEIRGARHYRDALRKAFVIADADERRKTIGERTAALATTRGLKLRGDEALLEEVTGLVEWPVPLIGRIDDSFMALPPEVLVTTMRTHQKFFALLDANGTMAPFFLAVANIETKDQGAVIVAGYERVLRARLADARFFWNADRKTRLGSRVAALDGITWHARLGSIGDKVRRIEPLALAVARHAFGAEPEQVTRAARLAKADLVTGLVGEFPELQGVMGRYYALADGEDEEVADAIRDHWGPAGPGDRCPSAPVSVVLALADKIDTLVGFFGIGETPTGSKDPYALRRAALGAIRLIIENRARVPLCDIFAAAARHFAGRDKFEFDGQALLSFFADRLQVALREKGVRHDLIDAVFAVAGEDDLVRLLARVEALRIFIESEDGHNLLVAHRRAANIAKIEAKNDKVGRFEGDPDASLYRQGEEKALAAALDRIAHDSRTLIEKEDFAGAMRLLAGLRAPVDAFFDKVTVNAPEAELRLNRLRLLERIGAVMDRIAVFARIEG